MRLTLTVTTSLLLAAGHAHAATWYVDDAARPGGTGASWSRALTTIGEAIDRSADGDTILIGAGTYEEKLFLDHVGRRSLYGAGAGYTILSGGPRSLDVAIDVRTGSGIDVHDLSFDGYSIAIDDGTGAPMQVIGCAFHGGDGLRLVSGNHRIEGNLFEDMDTAIRITPSHSNDSVAVVDNDFLGVREGVDTHDTPADEPGELTRVNILDNRFAHATVTAIWLADPNGRATVYRNLVTEGWTGLSIYGGAGIAVYDNIFDRNLGDAVQTTMGTGSIVYNTMRDNGGAGVRCYTVVWNDTSLVSNNAMVNNHYGLWWDGGCHARAETNAAWGNPWGNIVGLMAPYDLGGNLTVAFTLDTKYRPKAGSPLIGAATPGGAHLQLDYWRVSRGTSPDIGACEYVPQ